MSFLSTKIDEDIFNRLRVRERCQSAEQIGRLQGLHVVATSSLLSD